jgi:hypothetical protein
MVRVTLFYICSLPQTQRKTIPVFLKSTCSNLMRLPGKPSNNIDFRSLSVGAHIIRLIAGRCKILLKNSKLHKLYPKDVISRMEGCPLKYGRLPKLFARSGQLELYYCELKTNGIQVDMCWAQLSYPIMHHTNNHPPKACQWRFSALLPNNT